MTQITSKNTNLTYDLDVQEYAYSKSIFHRISYNGIVLTVTETPMRQLANMKKLMAVADKAAKKHGLDKNSCLF